MISVDFQHVRCELKPEHLIKFGSPHFDKNEAGRQLRDIFDRCMQVSHKVSLEFEESQILCANEAFPESAVADPLADLEVWDEWKSGIRAFPYPGRYSRLGIAVQLGKIGSTSSIGVLGEVMAGLFLQVGIAPWVLVRVIRKWPDFILHVGAGEYAFVESKAYTDTESNQRQLSRQLPDKLLGECLVLAVQQLNADAFVSVWGAFTAIRSITPLRLDVTFVELPAPVERKDRQSVRMAPEAVVTGLAEQAINRALSLLDPEQLEALLEEKRRPTRRAGRYEISVREMALGELEGVLTEGGLVVALSDARSRSEKHISRLLRAAKFSGGPVGRRLEQAKQLAVGGRFGIVRSVGGRKIFTADLQPNDRAAISESWTRDWDRASGPWRSKSRLDVWRCGGGLFALGEESMEGLTVDEIS